MRAPGSQTSLREANTARVLEAVRTFGAITQVELAAATGLSPATISNIVKQLDADGVIKTTATTRSGRRAQQVSLAPTSALGFGVHISPRSLKVYLADLSHTVSLQRSVPLPPDHRYDTTLDRVALLLGETVEEVGADIDEVTTLGVALPADLHTGPGPGGLPGWQDVDVAVTLGRRLHRPVVLVRQADAAAIAEARFGALRGLGTALYVRAAETIEASLLLDGTPHRGQGVATGALGHVQVDPHGAICRCGARGCLETVASSRAVIDLLRLSHGPVEMRQVLAACHRGDPGCRAAIAAAGAAMGPVLANAATLLGVERIVLGGETATAGEPFTEPIRAALDARPLLGGAAELLVDPAVGSAPEAVGAAALALDAVDLAGSDTIGDER